MLGEIKETCDNDLENPPNNLEVTSSLIYVIGSKVYYSKKDNIVAIYNGEIKGYIFEIGTL